MTTVTEMREKQQKLVADARAAMESIGNDTTEARAQELEQQYDAAMAEYDKLDKRASQMEKLAKAENSLEQPTEPEPHQPNKRADPETPESRSVDEIFRSYLQNGTEGLSSEDRSILREMRAQGTGTDAGGGYTVPQGFMNELVIALKAYGPMLDPGVTRELVTASGNQIDWPTMDDTSNKGALLGENTQDSEQDVAFGQKQLDAYKYTSKIIRVSEELLQDNAINVEGVVRDAMAERLGRIVNEHLTTGSGTGQPNGIVSASTNGTTATSNSAITFDEVIDLVHAVDPAYRNDPSVAFMFNDSTLQALRKLKDGNNNYIWQPADVRSGAPSNILGYSFVVNQDMASIGSSAVSVLFGAMNRYIVRRVREFAVKRLVERYADFHQVGFIGFGRFDGELIDTSAVKNLDHPV